MYSLHYLYFYSFCLLNNKKVLFIKMPHKEKVKCPKCNESINVIPIIYGKPGSELIEM